MQWFQALRIKTKLIDAFLIIAMLVGIVGGMGIYNMNQLDDAGSELYTNMTAPLGQLADLTRPFNGYGGGCINS